MMTPEIKYAHRLTLIYIRAQFANNIISSLSSNLQHRQLNNVYCSPRGF